VSLETILRGSLVLQWMLAALSILFFQLEARYISPLLGEYAASPAQATAGETIFGGLIGWIALVWLLGSVAASAGAYFFRGWSRPLFLAMALLGCGLQAMLEPSVTSPASAGAETGAQVLVGLIIGLLYFSPLKERFAHAA